MRISLSLKSSLIIALNVATVAAASAFVLPELKARTAVAAGGYTATWEMTKVRCVHIEGVTNVPTTPDNRLRLGPAEWKVTYSVSGGKSISETWTATGWNEYVQTSNPSTSPVRLTTQDASACTGSAVSNRITPSGQYGFALNENPLAGTYNHFFGASIPQGWKVTATTN